jgi:hypothetical protein
VVLLLALGACGPTKRLDQDLRGREKVAEIWYRADVSHIRRVIPAPIGSVWRVLPASIESLSFPGAPTIDSTNHIYATPQLKVEGRLYPDESNSLYVECGRTIGGQPAADEYRVVFWILTRLTSKPAGETEVDIIVDGTAQDMTEHSIAVRCHGTGRFEYAILQRIDASLAGR